MHIIILSVIYQHLVFIRLSSRDYKEKNSPTCKTDVVFPR